MKTSGQAEQREGYWSESQGSFSMTTEARCAKLTAAVADEVPLQICTTPELQSLNANKKLLCKNEVFPAEQRQVRKSVIQSHSQQHHAAPSLLHQTHFSVSSCNNSASNHASFHCLVSRDLIMEGGRAVFQSSFLGTEKKPFKNASAETF